MALQDGWSPIMMQINLFHDHVMVIITFIISLVLYIMLSMPIYPCSYKTFYGSEILEIVWTILPALILGWMAVPSLHTLYLADEVTSPSMTIKSVGHQWYWSYEYGDFSGVSFDSYMTQTSDLNPGSFRLLDVDNSVVMPQGVEVRVLTTSVDVIHSWTIPSFGVKVDAVPGRLNQLSMFSHRMGLAFGQCSEICGAMHSFMPICVEVVSPKMFDSWLKTFYLFIMISKFNFHLKGPLWEEMLIYPLVVFSALSLVVSVVLFVLAGVFSGGVEMEISNEPFECGFESFKDTRFPFSSHYFLIGILFVVFDVELVICLPLINTIGWKYWFLLWLMVLVILLVGFLMEVVMGSLDWKE